MKSSELLKRKDEVDQQYEDELEEYRKKRVRKETKNKKICGQEYINSIVKHSIDSNDSNANYVLLTYLAKHACLNDDKKSGMVAMTDDAHYYEDRGGRYRSLFNETDSYWPDKEDCIPTKKVKPANLRKFLESIEEIGKMKCWWGVGHISHTSYNLNMRVNRQLVMHFELKE